MMKYFKTICSGRNEVISIVGKDNLDLVRRYSPKAKYQLIAAFFIKNNLVTSSHEQNLLEELIFKLESLDADAIYTNSGVRFNNKIYDDLYDLHYDVSVIYNIDIENKELARDLKYNKPASQIHHGNIQVIDIRNEQDAVKFGRGAPWCIAKPFNHYYYAYRVGGNSKFYYVIDGNRDHDDTMRMVVIDVQDPDSKDGVKKPYLITDLNNITGYTEDFKQDYNAYLSYLIEHGVNVDIFQYTEPSYEEMLKYKLVFNTVLLSDFQNLPKIYQYYHIMATTAKHNEHVIDWIIRYNDITLIKALVLSGKFIEQEFANRIFSQYPELREKYLKARKMVYDRLTLHMNEEQFALFLEQCILSGITDFIDFMPIAVIKKRIQDIGQIPTWLISDNKLDKTYAK